LSGTNSRIGATYVPGRCINAPTSWDSGSHCRSTDSARKFRVPAGKLAPWGYVEYFPGWFAPGPELTNTPTIPKPR